MFDVVVPPEIRELAAGALVVTGQSSGGKDSTAAIHAGFRALQEAGIQFERAVMHSDLGLAEWRESLDMVRVVADIVEAPLHVVPPKGRGLIDRFWTRGRAGRERWAALETYHLIGPFSSVGSLFCSSEQKPQRLLRLTGQLWPGRDVVQIIGLRRDESNRRKRTPDIARVSPKLVAHGARVWSWYPIADWKADDVFAYHAAQNLPLHLAYTKCGSTRMSCCTCTVASLGDAIAAVRHPGNVPTFKAMFEIEAWSGFSYAPSRWAGELLAKHQPQHWTANDKADLERAMWVADTRRSIERSMPPELKYVQGWPIRMPTEAEASEIAEARRRLGEVVGLQPLYTDTDGVLARFDDLLRAKALKAAAEVGLYDLAA